MKSWLALTAGGFLLLGVCDSALVRGVDDLPRLAGADDFAHQKGPHPLFAQTILEFDTMIGVDRLFRAVFSNPIRGIDGGELPWVLDGARVELRDNGKLEVQVSGLVIPQADAPPTCNGAACNPAPFFRAVVEGVEGIVDVEAENITTDNGAEVMIGDPKDGNAEIEAMLDLPDPCLAPIVFVTNHLDVNDPQKRGVWSPAQEHSDECRPTGLWSSCRVSTTDAAA